MISDPLPLTRMLDEAVRLARAHFLTIFLPVGIPVAVAAALMQATQTFLQTGMAGGSGAMAIGGAAAIILTVAVYLLIYMFGYAAMQAAAVDAAAGRPLDMSRLWLTLARPPVFVTWLLLGLGVMAGVFCCILPGLYLGLLWAVTIPVVLEEGRAYTDALSRSAELMRHNPAGGIGNHPMLFVFLLGFVGALLSYAVSALVSLPFMALMMFVAFRAASSGERGDPDEMMQPFLWLQVPIQFVSVLAQMAVQVFVTMGIALLYFELRRRREGDDLARAVETIGTPNAPA